MARTIGSKEKPLSSMKQIKAPRRRARFDPRPLLLLPHGDRLLVTFDRPPGGTLPAPPQPGTQDRPGLRRRVPHPGHPFDHLRRPGQGHMSVGYPLAFGPANSAASTSPSCASSSLGNRPPCRRQPARRDQRHATRHATVMRSAARPPRPAPLPPAAPPARTCPQAASAAAATPQSPGRQPLACSMGIGKGDVPCTMCPSPTPTT